MRSGPASGGAADKDRATPDRHTAHGGFRCRARRRTLRPVRLVTDHPPTSSDLHALLVRHLPAVEGYLRLRMGPLLRAKESALDLVQSVARGALEDLAKFEFRGEGPFRQWLFARARHKLLEHVRHHRQARRDVRREVPIASESWLGLLANRGATDSPSGTLVNAEAIAAIERAFDEMPEEWQEAITLHRLGGLSHAEVATMMGKTEGAVRNLVYRGLGRLAMHLEPPRA